MDKFCQAALKELRREVSVRACVNLSKRSKCVNKKKQIDEKMRALSERYDHFEGKRMRRGEKVSLSSLQRLKSADKQLSASFNVREMLGSTKDLLSPYLMHFSSK